MQFGTYTLRDYQIEAYNSISEHLRTLSRLQNDDKEPMGAFVEASVGAGKTAIMGAVCARFNEMGYPVLCLARDLKLVEQNSATFWAMRVHNSIYSASYSKTLALADKVIVANEATASRAIESGAWDAYTPRAILIDECHQVDFVNEDSQYMQIINEINERNIKAHGKPVIIIGFTGSPYRHTNSIVGRFWRENLYQIDTATLVGRGYLVPTIYGYDVNHDQSLDYDMSQYDFKSEHGTADFSSKDLANMEKEIMADTDKLTKIIAEITTITSERNAVMITCAGIKHCKEVQRLLPDGQAVIVNSTQSKRTNDNNLNLIANGKAKYLLQVGCLTTGYDEPVIDTSVILRPIGSLTLLVQLLGRGMRLIKDEHKEQGVNKNDHLVLDYSGTMEVMGEMYENPILDECTTSKSRANNENLIECPECSEMNSIHARRCIGRVNGYRCEYFFSYVTCIDRTAPNGKVISRGCGAKNDMRSRACRNCDEWLNDPSQDLSGKHYNDNDYIDVLDFSLGLTRDATKLLARYTLANGGKARELFDVSSSESWKRANWRKFVTTHIQDKEAAKKIARMKSPQVIMQHVDKVRTPVSVTHRVNDKGFDILSRKNSMKYNDIILECKKMGVHIVGSTSYRGESEKEDAALIRVFHWLRTTYPEYAHLVFHPENEFVTNNRSSYAQHARSKAKGRLDGLCDIIFLPINKDAPTLLIELKRTNLLKSIYNQKARERMMKQVTLLASQKQHGALGYVALGYHNAVGLIEDYINEYGKDKRNKNKNSRRPS